MPKEDKLSDRNENLAKRKEVQEGLEELYEVLLKGWRDQKPRSDKASDYWDAFNGILNPSQAYNGKSQLFIPATYNAVEARVTRFANQIFPVSGQHVECLSSDPTKPQAMMSLAEHYIRKAKLRPLIPAMLRNGDVEGQYNIYVSWSKKKTHVVYKVKKDSMDGVGEVEDIVEETLDASHPEIEVLADSDILVLPFTADSIKGALWDGGSATILRRWSKAQLKDRIKDGSVDEDVGDLVLEEMSKKDQVDSVDKEKEAVHAAGIKGDARGKWALVYETWSMIEVDGELRICQTFFAGQDKILMCRLNPLWCDKVPLISAPAKKIAGSFKGQSLVKPILDIQVYINDMLNESADSSYYALLPIIMTDPEKNPNLASMQIAPACVWETSPNDTQFAQFPPLWESGLDLVQIGQTYIFQTLGVNPAMITMGAQKTKRNQAEIANEQQVDLLTTADAVTVVETDVLTPLLDLFIRLDHQYRDKDISVRRFGEMGMRLEMETISPVQMEYRYEYRWFGVESARNAQQIQQKISMLNVARGIPPQLLGGKKLDMSPAMTDAFNSTFGPTIGRQLFQDLRSQLAIDPHKEDEMMAQGHAVMVHPMDDHAMHLQVHTQFAQQNGDPYGTERMHIAEHMQEIQNQMQAMTGGPPGMQQGQPGGPGGGGGPGMPGQPRAGAQNVPPKPMQQPPGTINRDQLPSAGAIPMPRRM